MPDIAGDIGGDIALDVAGPALSSIALPMIPLDNLSEYDTSQTLYTFQGDTYEALVASLSDPSGKDLTTGLVSAKLYFQPYPAPSWFGPPMPQPGMFGASADITNLPAVSFVFPSNWGDSSLPVGTWFVYIQATYAGGRPQTFGLSGLLCVQPAVSLWDGGGDGSSGPVESGLGTPSPSLLSLLNAMKAELDQIKAAQLAGIDEGTTP